MPVGQHEIADLHAEDRRQALRFPQPHAALAVHDAAEEARAHAGQERDLPQTTEPTVRQSADDQTTDPFVFPLDLHECEPPHSCIKLPHTRMDVATDIPHARRFVHNGNMTRWQAYLYELMRRLGVNSQNQLAARVGVSQSTVSRWLSGAIPSADEVLKVAQRTGDDPIELLRLAGLIADGGRESHLSPVAEQRVRYLASLADRWDEEEWEHLRWIAERFATDDD
jgi:transcriptional regulator with XRE-family HTH domain